MKKRIEWIDTLKGLGVFYVVFAHLSPAIEIEKYIYSFHMFLFFAISGFLHTSSKKTLKEFVLHKAKALLIPFWAWNICATAVSFVVNKDIPDVIMRFFTIQGTFCWDRPIWFLPALFFTEVAYTLLERYASKWKGLCVLAAPFLWYALDGATLFMKLDMVPIALFFYWFGTLLRKMLDKQFVVEKKALFATITLLISALVHILFGVLLNGRISYTGSSFGNYLYCVLAGIAGVVFYFVLCRMLRPGKILSWLGQNSLFIVCSHYWILTVGSTLSEKFFDYDIWHARGTFKAIVVSVVLLLITWGCLAVVKTLCDRYPWLKKLASLFGVAV